MDSAARLQNWLGRRLNMGVGPEGSKQWSSGLSRAVG